MMYGQQQLTPEEFEAMFEENIKYLQKNIPPDDIYAFAEQQIIMGLYFMKRWSLKEDINEDCKINHVARQYVTTLLGFVRLREQHMDVIEKQKGTDANNNTGNTPGGSTLPI